MAHAPGPFNMSMREWSRRHLSFSGDWTSRFRSKSRSRSATRSSVVQRPQPQPSRPLLQILKIDGKLSSTSYFRRTHLHRFLTGGNSELPSKESSKKRPTTLSDPSLTQQNDTPSHTPSQRTPGGRHYHNHTRTMTPMSSFRSRPGIQRSSSQGGHGSPIHVAPPRSARRGARTAHLHEVKPDVRTRSPRTHRRDLTPVRGSQDVDVLSAPATVPRAPFVRLRRDLSVTMGDVQGKGVQLFGSTPLRNKVGEGDPWEDTDFDFGDSEEDVEREYKVDTVRASSVSAKEH
jgi:hypothetical protein